MSTLSVPPKPTGTNTLNRSGSASSLRRSNVEHEDDLAPISRSRRNSDSVTHNASPMTISPGAPGSAAAQAGLVPLPQGAVQARAENAALTSAADSWGEHAGLQPSDPRSETTNLYIGKERKRISVPTAQLVEKSPYFRKQLAEQTGRTGKMETTEPMTFEELDEFGMGLFMMWMQDGGKLGGPRDFHSLAHYLALYVLARKFEVEGLENQVMDLVRHYYAEQNMTAPAYRLEYIYTYTHPPNMMRRFLISTAAFRALEEVPRPEITAANPMLQKSLCAPGAYLSDSIKGVLAKDPEMAIDFIEALIKLHRDGETDARRGSDCEWHEHLQTQTQRCKEQPAESWQSDGPADVNAAPIPPAPPAAPSAPPAVAPKPAPPNNAAVPPKKDDKAAAAVKSTSASTPIPPQAAVTPSKPATQAAAVPVVAPKAAAAKPAPPIAPAPATPAKRDAAPHPGTQVPTLDERKFHRPAPSPTMSSTWAKLLYRTETQRLQWEMTERALEKNDHGLFRKMRDKVHEAKDKLHTKQKPADAKKPSDATPADKK